MQKADSPHKQFELICVIVNFGLGSKVLSLAKRSGISGGTITLGRGTVRNRWLELLELTDTRKEIVLMIGERILCRNALKILDQKFHFRKPNHGIAFTMSVGAFIGTGNYDYEFNAQDGDNGCVYKAVVVIVDKGKGEEVMDVATVAGARGGTIMNARGSGIHETATFLNMEIEPEKEVVLMLIKGDLGDRVVNALRDNLHIDQPGNGIIFVQSVNETLGLVTES